MQLFSRLVIIEVPASEKTPDKKKLGIRKGPLTDGFLTFLCNIAPYIQSLLQQTSALLVKMFELVSVPSFLLTAPRSFGYAANLLEAMSMLLQYQFPGWH